MVELMRITHRIGDGHTQIAIWETGIDYFSFRHHMLGVNFGRWMPARHTGTDSAERWSLSTVYKHGRDRGLEWIVQDIAEHSGAGIPLTTARPR